MGINGSPAVRLDSKDWKRGIFNTNVGGGAKTGAAGAQQFVAGCKSLPGTTVSITNPGTIGTEHSVPRLVAGQGCIVGVGAMEYPAAYQGASAETLTGLAISKTVTLTSTYDHRIIQGAQSGDFLKVIHQVD